MAIELKKEQLNSDESALSRLQDLLVQKPKITNNDRMFLLEQLALLLETGIPLYEALSSICEQIVNSTMREMVEALMFDLSEGKSFSHAISKHPDVFSKTHVSLIAASENGGFMHEVLTQIMEMEEKREKLSSTLVSAFSYPAFLMFFSCAVMIFVLVVVFPKFADMFASIHDQLPATTIFLMATSNILINQWPFVIGGLAGLIFLMRMGLKSPTGAEKMDHIKLHFPVLKEIFIKLYLVQLFRVMSISLANGVTVIETLSVCREVVKNRIFQRFVQDVEKTIEEGNGISAGFTGVSFIPAIAQQMIKTGENSGNLPSVMLKVAEYFERELTRKLETITRYAEPVMLLFMGLVVGVLVSSLILPIFKLSSAVH